MTQATTSTIPATAPTDPVAIAVASVVAQVTSKLGANEAQALQPVIEQYGPAFATMTADEIWSWIGLASQGDAFATYQALLAKMPSQDLMDQWASIAAKWQSANAANAAAVAWQRNAVSALLSALVTIAASMVAL